MKDFNQITNEAEAKFQAIGEVVGKEAKERAYFLAESISKTFPIQKILNGMGSYSLIGDKVPVKDIHDGSIYSVSLNDFFLGIYRQERLNYEILNLTNEIKAWVTELIEILEWLNNPKESPYIPLFDIILKR